MNRNIRNKILEFDNTFVESYNSVLRELLYKYDSFIIKRSNIIDSMLLYKSILPQSELSYLNYILNLNFVTYLKKSILE